MDETRVLRIDWAETCRAKICANHLKARWGDQCSQHSAGVAMTSAKTREPSTLLQLEHVDKSSRDKSHRAGGEREINELDCCSSSRKFTMPFAIITSAPRPRTVWRGICHFFFVLVLVSVRFSHLASHEPARLMEKFYTSHRSPSFLRLFFRPRNSDKNFAVNFPLEWTFTLAQRKSFLSRSEASRRSINSL